MIRVENLGFCYGSVRALDRVSFTVNKGEIVGLLGPNGAGKSTTMKVLTTFLYPQEGKVTVLGTDVAQDPFAIRGKIGYLPEILPLYQDMEVSDYLHFVAKARGLSGVRLKERLDGIVDRCALGPVFRHLTRELSKGYRQRVGIAQALIHDPEVIIFDEPTSGLDPHQIREIRSLLRELGRDKTVILSTHVLQEAQAVSDRLVIINQGKIVGDGTVEELRNRACLSERTFVSVLNDRSETEMRLKSIEGIKNIDYIGEENGYHGFTLISSSESKLCPRIGTIARENGWQLGRLTEQPFSLEETFLALTKEEQGRL